eukprot:gene5877-5781_t
MGRKKKRLKKDRRDGHDGARTHLLNLLVSSDSDGDRETLRRLAFQGLRLDTQRVTLILHGIFATRGPQKHATSQVHVWPTLLGAVDSPTPLYDPRSTYQCRDSHQIQKDIERSLWFIECERDRAALRDQLSRLMNWLCGYSALPCRAVPCFTGLAAHASWEQQCACAGAVPTLCMAHISNCSRSPDICSVISSSPDALHTSAIHLSTFPYLYYFQGLHDIAAVLLVVCGETGCARLLCHIAHRHIAPFMAPDLGATKEVMALVQVGAAHPCAPRLQSLALPRASHRLPPLLTLHALIEQEDPQLGQQMHNFGLSEVPPDTPSILIQNGLSADAAFA